MKKSLIWLLTVVMALTFGGLIYVQIMYMEKMTRMRSGQFNENVNRALSALAGYIERQETLHYLEEDVREIEAAFYSDYSAALQPISEEADSTGLGVPSSLGLHPKLGIESDYEQMQQTIRNEYLYQRGLLNEVILNIMRSSGHRPVVERVDSNAVRTQLRAELADCGITLPFEFAVTQGRHIVYRTKGYRSVDDGADEDELYTQKLFPYAKQELAISIFFPTKGGYIFNSVRWLIPTLSFTIILLIVFLYTILLAFRQKRITEMKNDFINNMTHEFKTPISTISLAAQMLADASVRKSPTMLAHLSDVINDETKRLRFQVEKVLQMSMFDRRQPNLKFTEVDLNQLVEQVVHTFKIKVEKFGGSIEMDLGAEQSCVLVDEMHFTNVVFNLLDNAVKYRDEERPPVLKVSTRDVGDKSVELRIADNGIGIKREHLKRIFEKFYRVPTGNRHDVKGFGLGLAYVYKMIGEFKGTIKVESEPGRGTTFIITLPLEEG